MPKDQATNIFQLNSDTTLLVTDIQQEKYQQADETAWDQSCHRVAFSLLKDDPDLAEDLYGALVRKIAVPGGRVMAGAGTTKNVTWWNCFVSPLLQDSMKTDPRRPGLGIMDTLSHVAYSMQMGGGVGTDFSTLRPKGAIVRRVHSEASGPLSYMDMWDGMCRTIMSAGYRRGAMMATLRCDHPDLMAFITAKHDPNRLRMFNVSVLITDAFMEAVENDLSWDLGHWEPPFGTAEGHAFYKQKSDPYRNNESHKWYVYQSLSARHIWQAIMESNYNYAEPGVIFIDRINRMNNLWYCEYIQSTNPCGEQPLPPNQNCNLSHLNLSRCVVNPFTDQANWDIEEIVRITKLLVRMSDNVIDLSPIPTEEQAFEAQQKRRIGLGVTGLGNALMFLKARYGGSLALGFINVVMTEIRNAAYRESIELAKEKGAFPAFDNVKYLESKFVKTLPEDIQDGIAKHGIRNALLLTIAPVGTMSVAQCDNSSSGLEPVFAARYGRKKLAPDGTLVEFTGIEDFGFRVYANMMFGGDMDAALAAPLQDYMVTTADLDPEDHLLTQAEVQKYIDASISKTINLPQHIKFDEFTHVYKRAYELGCKGCTTYRPNPESGRGEVLVDTSKRSDETAQPVVQSEMRKREDALFGKTYRLRWKDFDYPLYVTINHEEQPDGSKIPFEVFINSKGVEHAHWQAGLTRMISAVMRKGGDLTFIPDELKQVWSARGGEHRGSSYIPSEVALIGYVMEEEFKRIGYMKSPPSLSPTSSKLDMEVGGAIVVAGPTFAGKVVGIVLNGKICGRCQSPSVIKENGCEECKSCGWSSCG